MADQDDRPVFLYEALEQDEDHIVAACQQLTRYFELTMMPQTTGCAGPSRLSAALEKPEERYAPFHGRLRSLFGLSEPSIRSLFIDLERPNRWHQTPFPGILVADVLTDALVAPAGAQMIKAEPGALFPMHRHLGDETFLVLSGACEDNHGHITAAGEICHMLDTSIHSVRALPRGPCLAALVFANPPELL